MKYLCRGQSPVALVLAELGPVGKGHIPVFPVNSGRLKSSPDLFRQNTKQFFHETRFLKQDGADESASPQHSLHQAAFVVFSGIFSTEAGKIT